jgi:cytochrome c
MRPPVVVGIAAVAVMGLGLMAGNIHPFGDPRLEPPQGVGMLLQGANMSKDAKAVLLEKCADCHSSETRWPVYARVAPGSWLIERDIVKAREKMDLSRWEEMPPEKQQLLMVEIALEAKKGEMPPLQYLALHWRSNLSEDDVRTLSRLGKNAVGTEAALGGGGNAARGEGVFQKHCTGCHAMNADREGPRLAGLYGRKAGSVSGFTYSKGMKNSNWTWTDATLEKWLSDPDLMIPDNNMSFSVPKAEERRDLIAYLKQ